MLQQGKLNERLILPRKTMNHSPEVRFGQLTIQGFRRLLDVRLALRPLSVMIGANGTGKTSVLDVLSLLASSAQGRLSSPSISEMSGLANVLTYDRADELGLGITLKVPAYELPLEYSLSLRPHGIAHAIREETLGVKEKLGSTPFRFIDSHDRDVKYFDPQKESLVPPKSGHDPLETSLSQAPRIWEAQEEFRRRLASATFYRVLNVDPRSPVRLPQSLVPAELPGRNGEDLVSCLYNLREADKGRFEAVEDSLRAVFPRFEGLAFPPVKRRVRWGWLGTSVDSRRRFTRTNYRKELCGSYG